MSRAISSIKESQSMNRSDHNRRIRLASPLVALLVALAALGAAASPAAAKIAVTELDGLTLRQDGTADTRAGGHPFSLGTSFSLGTKTEPIWGVVPAEELKDMRITLPPGLVGDPTALPQCPEERLESYQGNNCPADTQIGTVRLVPSAALGMAPATVPLFNMIPPRGVAAQFGFAALSTTIHLNARVLPDEDYRLAIDTVNTPEVVPLVSVAVTIWGAPADSSHDELRGTGADGLCADPGTEEPCSNKSTAPRTAFLSNPADCSAGPLETTAAATSWEHPADVATASFRSHLAPPDQATLTGVTECDRVPFAPTLSVVPEEHGAAAPSGLGVHIDLPQTRNPEGIATSPVKRATVRLPEGVRVNAGSADGLVGCSPAQIEAEEDAPGHGCPGASKIGTVQVATPLLAEPLGGAIYLAQPDDPKAPGAENPFGSLLAAYLVVSNAERGVTVSLPGRIDTDERSGQLTASFEDVPQLPFGSLDLQLKGGPRAPLSLPDACGTYTTTYSLTSWSGKTVDGSSQFTVDQSCGNDSKFTPGFEAGTANPVAGSHSPFTLRVTRPDAQQNVAGIEATLPEGLLAKLAGVPLCPEAAAGTGSCPSGTQVGTATVGAGAGSNPLYVPQAGKAPAAVYLAGPYKGAPYSLIVGVPAQAGPFDLGTVTVRNALAVDPVTTQVSAKSDPLPQILQGIPIAYRDIRVDVDRGDFTVNPTSCDPMQVTGAITSAQGTRANVADRFQVADCAALGFSPALKLKLSGGMKRGSYPKLLAELSAPAGQANIGRVSVALPHSEFLAQSHIKTICTRVQYAASGGGGRACPPGSVYGWARAFTPLLDQPLEGPVYLRSSSNPLPDLVASLDGEIHIDLAGRIDSVRGGIRTTFEGVPDAPVSKFVLTMQGGRKGLLENSRNLCAGSNRATVQMDGQNGKAHDFRPVMKNGCGKKAARKTHKR
jgi:hypothetical protein